MRYFSFLLIVGSLHAGQPAFAQQPDRYTVAFYHLEPFFDATDNVGDGYDDFRLGGLYGWTVERYTRRLKQTARAIASLDDGGPNILALTNVGNRQVLDDLINTRALAHSNYEVLHILSGVGTDVALLYKAGTMTVPRLELLPVPGGRPMLLATGFPTEDDSVHFLVTHWDDGLAASAALSLDAVGDSLRALNPQAKILVLGHFGVSPEDPAMRQTLQASDVVLLNGLSGKWYNPARLLARYGKGTRRMAGKDWEMADQMLMSSALMRGQRGVSYQSASVLISDAEFLFDADGSPAPVFRGPQYAGGYGESLPLLIRMKKQ